MSLEAFAQKVGGAHLVPLWDSMRGMLPPAPAAAGAAAPQALPHRRRCGDWRPPLLDAATLVTAEAAERRVLLLESPAFAGEYRVAATIHAGLQLLAPGVGCAAAPMLGRFSHLHFK